MLFSAATVFGQPRPGDIVYMDGMPMLVAEVQYMTAMLCPSQPLSRSNTITLLSSHLWYGESLVDRGYWGVVGSVTANSTTGRFWGRAELRDARNGTVHLGTQHWVDSGDTAHSVIHNTRVTNPPGTGRMFFGNVGNDPGR